MAKIIKVELIICKSDNTWHLDYVDIFIPENKLTTITDDWIEEEAIKKFYETCKDSDVAHFGLYSYSEEEIA